MAERHALLIEDDVPSLEALERLVQSKGFTTCTAQTLEQARKEIDAQVPDLAILDLDLPDGSGMELFDELHTGFDTEVVVVTGQGTIDSAVEAIHSGVVDYFTKPLDIERFERFLTGLERTLSLRREVSRLRADLRELGRFDRMVGSSAPMQEVYNMISRVARTESTVLVTGETGTGKDLVAQTVHGLSRRADKPFVAVNCGAVQESLIESELFGHEPGAFTGANKRRKGLFEQARGGTLFLDEITEMPPDLQVKLLRVLENRTIRRLGGERTIAIDVRLIAATNRRPDEAVKAGKLREDLFYRLQVFPIRVPPLRDRPEDVDLLATYFLRELNESSEGSKRLDPAALEDLRTHDWPGNVRELRYVIERAYILAGERIGPEHVQIDPGRRRIRVAHGVGVDVGMSIADAEKLLILATLDELDGNKKKAADVLGISLKTLYNRLNAYGMGRTVTTRVRA
jgi:DNA-binding NtrC family response regulator